MQTLTESLDLATTHQNEVHEQYYAYEGNKT